MKYTIEDLRNGKVAVINDGTLGQLKEVLDLNSHYINKNNIRRFNALGQEFTPTKGQLYFQNGSKYIQE